MWAIVGGLLPLTAAGGTYYVLDPKLPPILQPIGGSPGTKKGPVTPLYYNSQRELDL